MKECVTLIRPHLWGKALQLANWYIAEEDGSVCGGSSADPFVNVSDRDVYRPGLLIAAEDRELGFVRGEDDWAYSSSQRYAVRVLRSSKSANL